MTIRHSVARTLARVAMSIAQPRRRAAPPPAPRGVGRLWPSWEAAVPQYPDPRAASLRGYGFEQSEVAFGAIDLIARSGAQVEFVAVDAAGAVQPAASASARALLTRPSPQLSGFDLTYGILQDLLVFGNAFVEKMLHPRYGHVVGLWRLDPLRVSVWRDDARWVSRYDYEVGGVQKPIPATDVVHVRFPSIRGSVLGFPPLLVAMRAIQADIELTNLVKLLAENHAIPPIVVTAAESTKLTQPAVDELTDWWMESFGGENRGAPGFLQGGMQVQRIGMSLEELAMPELRALNESRILMVLGGAPLQYLLGSTAGMKRSIYSNFSEAREALADDVLAPLWRLLASALDTQLAGDILPPGLRFAIDTANVLALAPRRERRLKAATAALSAGLLTRHRALALAGEVVDGPDFLLLPTAADAPRVAGGGLGPDVRDDDREDPDAAAAAAEGGEEGGEDEGGGDEGDESEAG